MNLYTPTMQRKDGFDWEAFKADVKRVRSIPYRGVGVPDREAKAFRAAPYHGWPL